MRFIGPAGQATDTNAASVCRWPAILRRRSRHTTPSLLILMLIDVVCRLQHLLIGSLLIGCMIEGAAGGDQAQAESSL